MATRLPIKPAPHLRDELTTQKIMLLVMAALVPAAMSGIIRFGWRAAFLMVFCIAVSMGTEGICRMLMKREQTIQDGSAALTGLLLALNLPVTLPLWAAGVGCVFAIAVVKQLFGGLGQNFANPAITARVFLMLSLTSDMTNWILPRGKTLYFGYDAVSAATPLVNTDVSLQDLFWGAHGGCIGETCAAALLFGGMFLIFLGLVSPTIPGAYLGSFALCVLVYSGGDFHEMFYQLMAGGLMLGAFFMATDYVTSPVTTLGRILFGIGCGVLTFLIRYFGSFPEGVSLAILLMDILTPYLDRLTMPRPFGAAGKGDAA